MGGQPGIVAGMAATMALLWLGTGVPRSWTAGIPLLVLPLTGVQGLADVSKAYAHPLVVLMFAGLVLGYGMEQVGLPERVVHWLMRMPGARFSAKRGLLAFMIAVAVLSGMVSNTATAVTLLPTALLLARRFGASVPAFGLGLAWAATIGGLTTLVGTPPNLVLAGILEDVGRPISFARWLLVGIPAAALLLPAAWLVLTRVWDLGSGEILEEPAQAWRPGERAMLGVVGLAMFGWLSRSPKDLGPITIPGWSQHWAGSGAEADAWVGLTAAMFTLFVVRLDVGKMLHRINWGVLVLIGGGFALAKSFAAAGLTEQIAKALASMADLPTPMLIFVLVTLIVVLTEITSNTATTQVALPILAPVAIQAGVAPEHWLVPVTLAASAAFMLPVATAPNAIAAEGADIDPRDMRRAGAWLNGAAIIVIWTLSVWWIPFVLR